MRKTEFTCNNQVYKGHFKKQHTSSFKSAYLKHLKVFFLTEHLENGNSYQIKCLIQLISPTL